MVAVVLALASAVSFGGSDYTAGLATRVTSVIRVVLGLNRAGSGSGQWPVLVGQAASLFVVVCAGAVRRELRMPADRKTRVQSVVTGVTGTAGTILFFVASHDGLLAVTSVITSLYPAVTIVLARVLLGERLSRMRLAGLCLAGASVALIAIAGAG